MPNFLLSLAANNPLQVGSLVGIVVAIVAIALIYVLVPKAQEPVAFGSGAAGAWWLYQSTTDENGVGTIRQEPGTKIKYKWVKLIQTASQTGAAGDIVVYTTLTGYTASVFTVSTDASADGGAVPIGAGVLTASITAAQGTAGVFLWIQITGFVTLSTAVTSAAAGKMFNASTTDKTGTVMADDFSVPMGISTNTTTGAILTCDY